MIWSYPALKDVTGRPVVVDVHDGDTLKLGLQVSAETAIYPALRVKGLYCPELGEDGGLAAWLFTANTLAAARDIHVTIFGRSFARFVAQVLVDNRDLAEIVIAAGHGTATA